MSSLLAIAPVALYGPVKGADGPFSARGVPASIPLLRDE
jgi:hypothetical protein